MTLLYDPLLWFGVALLLYGAWVNGRWHEGGSTTTTLSDIATPAGLLRAAYLFGPALLVVALRLVRPGTMGLRLPPLEPLAWLGILGTTLVASALLAIPLRERRAAAFQRRATPGTMGRIGHAGMEALLLEAHWAFARAAALSVGIARGGDDLAVNLAAGLLLALLLLAFEAALDPRQRAAWTLGDPRVARTGVLAALSMWLFAIGLSSLVAFGAHWLLRATLIEPTVPAAPPPTDTPKAAVPRRATAAGDVEIEPTVV